MLDIWLKRRMAEYNGVGIEPKEVAAAVDVHPATVGRWLDGTSIPERLQVLKLAILFKVSIATIMRQTDPDEFARLAGIEEARRGVEPDALEEGVIRLLRALPADERAAWLMLLRKRQV